MKLKNYWRFLAVFLFLLVSLLILEQTKTLARKDNWPVMLNCLPAYGGCNGGCPGRETEPLL